MKSTIVARCSSEQNPLLRIQTRPLAWAHRASEDLHPFVWARTGGVDRYPKVALKLCRPNLTLTSEASNESNINPKIRAPESRIEFARNGHPSTRVFRQGAQTPAALLSQASTISLVAGLSGRAKRR